MAIMQLLHYMSTLPVCIDEVNNVKSLPRLFQHIHVLFSLLFFKVLMWPSQYTL